MSWLTVSDAIAEPQDWATHKISGTVAKLCPVFLFIVSTHRHLEQLELLLIVTTKPESFTQVRSDLLLTLTMKVTLEWLHWWRELRIK